MRPATSVITPPSCADPTSGDPPARPIPYPTPRPILWSKGLRNLPTGSVPETAAMRHPKAVDSDTGREGRPSARGGSLLPNRATTFLEPAPAPWRRLRGGGRCGCRVPATKSFILLPIRAGPRPLPPHLGRRLILAQPFIS